MSHRPTVRAANGIVASGHHLATAAGIAALRDGGSAVDAAIAAAAVCAVVLPQRTAIGGDVFALVYDAGTRTVTAYNGSGAAPAMVDPIAFSQGFGNKGVKLATVPGCVGAWGDMLADHGRLGIDRVLSPAIAYAGEGFPVSDALSLAIGEESDRLDVDPTAARTYSPRGRHPRAGEMLQQPDLATSLRAIAADGADTFYRGELAERIAAGIAALGGWITADDLAAHRTDRREPIETRYRGLRVVGQPPVSQGHILLEELAIADGLDLRSMGWGSADQIHAMVEIKKLAFADRDALAGDPRAVPFVVEELLAEAFIAQRRRAIAGRAAERVEPAALPADTTYLATVDRDGNAVSLIESVFSAFGSATMVPGTGVLLNNRLSGFSLDPRSPNVLAARKRPVHTLNTVMVLDGSSPRFVYGTPGRHAQVQTNFQLGVGLIDHGLDVQAAVEAPRWYHESGRTLQVEARLPEQVRKGLAAKGHDLHLLGDWAEITGGAQAVAIDENGVFSGGADPRREGYAAGY
ncbi:MAG TPA: gamma-glutamyltransferase [Candidatus Limnocylindria bacterium]|jgi:gamma-glutamyltranspeptidase/glutathione hydrolase